MPIIAKRQPLCRPSMQSSPTIVVPFLLYDVVAVHRVLTLKVPLFIYYLTMRKIIE